MTAQLQALCFDAHDPQLLARFWARLLGWKTEEDGTTLVPADDTGFNLRFLASDEPKRGQNQVHFDLTSSSPEQMEHTVALALELGARHHDVGQGPDAKHVVMADPEGNEFCVIPPGNRFLAECGFLGALASDGTQAVGYFWSRALDYPLVWDQDEETAIRAPHGGPKITWGGPPVAPKLGKNRLHFDLAVPPGGSAREEADRLVALGAAIVGEEPGRFLMTDPDGNEFCLLTGA